MNKPSRHERRRIIRLSLTREERIRHHDASPQAQDIIALTMHPLFHFADDTEETKRKIHNEQKRLRTERA